MRVAPEHNRHAHRCNAVKQRQHLPLCQRLDRNLKNHARDGGKAANLLRRQPIALHMRDHGRERILENRILNGWHRPCAERSVRQLQKNHIGVAVAHAVRRCVTQVFIQLHFSAEHNAHIPVQRARAMKGGVAAGEECVHILVPGIKMGGGANRRHPLAFEQFTHLRRLFHRIGSVEIHAGQ